MSVLLTMGTPPYRLTKLKKLNKTFGVPSPRKFKEVEEATAAIADIILRDVHQGQGPDTVKKIASLRLNLPIPRYICSHFVCYTQ